MLFTTELAHSKLSQVPIGNLVLLLDGATVSAGLTAKNEDGDPVVVEMEHSSDFSHRFIDPSETCLIVGPPVVQFSASNRNNTPPNAGDLIIDTEGWGFYAPVRPGHNRILRIDGRALPYHFSHQAKAFPRWSAGIMRGDEFIGVIER